MTQAQPYLSSVYDDSTFSIPPGMTGSMKPAIGSSILMAIGGMGDALLYAYLPVKGEALGLTVLSIGVLLSINKFARFFTNRWVAYISHKWGIKNVLLLGVILSSLTTLTYAFNPAVWIWVIARILWGSAFSALRFSTFQYAVNSKKTGSALGIGRSIQDLGPLLAYWIGPFMLNYCGSAFTFTAWAFFLVALLPFFKFIPDVQLRAQSIGPLSFQKPEWIDVWVFISSYIIEGLLIVGISKLLPINTDDAHQLLLASAIYISLRRLLNVIISPLSGWLGDAIGFSRLFQSSCLMIVAGLVMIAIDAVETGILTTFIGAAVNTTLVPIVALEQNPSNKSFDVLTRISTSRDIGSAFGSLTGLILLNVSDARMAFTILSVLLIIVWFKIRKLEKHYE